MHKIYIDGASRGNPGPASVGVSIQNNKGEEIKVVSECIGQQTNNVAEYMALVFSLHACTQLGLKEINFFSDSELLVKQIKGEYKVKESHVRILYLIAKHMLTHLNAYTIQHVKREFNKRADQLANEALERVL